MNKFAQLIAASGVIAVSTLAFAKPVKSITDPVMLYAQPNVKAKIIDKFQVDTRLIPIYREGAWVKVGNPADGQIGWVSLKNYQSAHKAHSIQASQKIEYSQPAKSFVFEASESGGKPANIVAYVNGKKLNKRQAKILLGKMRAEQADADQHFIATQEQLDRLWRHSLRQFYRLNQQMLNQQTPMHQPSIIVLEPGPVLPVKVSGASRLGTAKSPKSPALLPNPMKPTKP